MCSLLCKVQLMKLAGSADSGCFRVVFVLSRLAGRSAALACDIRSV